MRGVNDMYFNLHHKAFLQRGIKSAILGFAVGDALGVPVEFMDRAALLQDPVTGMRSGGTYNQPAGTWSDDTSMTLCTMDSLIEKGIDYSDQMLRFCDWLWNAANTAHDEVFDVGGTTKHAVFAFAKKTPPLECGETAENTCGNGSLMRILPTALYLFGQYHPLRLEDQIAEIIHNASKCTHAHPRCQMACGIYSSVVFALLAGGSWLHNNVIGGIASALAYYRNKPEFAQVYPEFESLLDVSTWDETQINSSGFVLHTLQAALWCLLTTSGYAECVLKAVNLGEDTDTTAAVAGGLAGLWYGEKEIPKDWAAVTEKYEAIKALGHRFSYACLD